VSTEQGRRRTALEGCGRQAMGNLRSTAGGRTRRDRITSPPRRYAPGRSRARFVYSRGTAAGSAERSVLFGRERTSRRVRGSGANPPYRSRCSRHGSTTRRDATRSMVTRAGRATAQTATGTAAGSRSCCSSGPSDSEPPSPSPGRPPEIVLTEQSTKGTVVAS
jgi:hypothetical protein